jgi:hypothetical protein
MTITDDNGNFVCELCGRFKAKKVKVMSKWLENYSKNMI